MSLGQEGDDTVFGSAVAGVMDCDAAGESDGDGLAFTLAGTALPGTCTIDFDASIDF